MSRTYQTGAPTMVAAAPGLPSIPAEQIARDVTSEFNPRTGARELIAAPFDPFEEDPSLAGSLRLLSADGGVSIDGRPLNDGAIVEMDFYYNSPSDDPFGGRNYSEVSFVNGELAPVVLRDTRVLECSTRVENVVYNHASYYDRGRSVGIYRPYRHYTGHSSFGFGFGSNYFGPGYGSFLSSRSYGNSRYSRNTGSYGVRSNTRTRSSRPSTGRRDSDASRNRDGADDRRDRSDRRTDSQNNTAQPSRTNARRLTDRDIDERLSRVQSYGVGRTRSAVRQNARGSNPMRAGITSQRSRIRTTAPSTQQPVSQSTQPETQTPRAQRSRTQRSRTEGSRTQRSETRQTRSTNQETRSADRARAQPRSASNSDARPKTIKTSAPSRSVSKTNERSKQRSTRRSSSPSRSTERSAPSRRSSSNASKRKLNFFPNDGYGSRSVVSSTSVDCAREDKLRIFIPNARLDAARFDGLTIIALDAQGGETPIYLPPNYIEGFRMAATGRVRAQGYQPQPQTTTPQYATPQYRAPQVSTPLPRARIEAAPCPSGTTKQVDGTCLQVSTAGYIYR